MDHPAKHVHYTLAILFVINFLNFYDRAIFGAKGAVAEPIRKLWALTDSQIGWLATAFTLLYAVVGVPLAVVGPWQPLSIASNRSCSVERAHISFRIRLELCLAVRGATGSGCRRGILRASRKLPDRSIYPASRRARALAIFMLGLPLGLFLGGLSADTSQPATAGAWLFFSRPFLDCWWRYWRWE